MERMLVVEDDILSQDVMKRIFKNDFIIDLCDSAEEFYEKFSQNNYGIIIMDISLKGSKHGLELVKELKSIQLHKNTPIICLTAHTHSTMRLAAMEAGTDLFMNKPVSNKQLKDAVESFINRSRTDKMH
jgi:two-component system, OmpR family, response regulator